MVEEKFAVEIVKEKKNREFLVKMQFKHSGDLKLKNKISSAI